MFHDKSKHIEKIDLEGYVDSYWVGRALQGVASVWDQVLSLGLAGINPVWHGVQLKQSMSQLVHLVVREYG